MTRITIAGGTGYTGSAIAREAVSRGLDVTSFSRTVPQGEDRIDGVTYETGSLLEPGVRARAMSGTDVLVSTLSPRGELDGRIVDVNQELASLAAADATRMIVIGGFSSLRPSESELRFADADDLPALFASEAKQMNAVLNSLLASPDALDFVFLSPAMQYGAHAPGVSTGRYRLGGDVALFDADGVSALSGADFARAIIDEIQTPSHHRAHISVAY